MARDLHRRKNVKFTYYGSNTAINCLYIVRLLEREFIANCVDTKINFWTTKTMDISLLLLIAVYLKASSK